MKINARTKSVMVAMFLLTAISLAYRYTERYEYGKKEEEGVLEKDPEAAKRVKEKNITQADLDEIMKVIT